MGALVNTNIITFKKFLGCKNPPSQFISTSLLSHQPSFWLPDDIFNELILAKLWVSELFPVFIRFRTEDSVIRDGIEGLASAEDVVRKLLRSEKSKGREVNRN